MKNKLHRFFTLFVVIGLCISQLFAVPAFRGWQERTLTDGTPIRVRLVGDEFYHLWETEDGKIATMQEDGTFIISSEKAPSMKQVSERRQSARAAKIPASRIQKNYGDIQPTKLLVILVNFSDKSMKSTHNNAFFDNLLNGSFPSVKDYFKQSSGNTYVPQFDVFGPYTLDQNMAYYGGNDSDGNDEHPDQMVVDACAKAYADGCNFSNYDTNNDGKVDNIYVIYAGYGEAAGAPANTIWPHSWEIYSGNVTGTLKYNNKTLGHYACSAELSGKSGSNSDGVGTFAHEFSHVIGLPDYYDTDYGTNSDNGVTPGEWTLMDQGSYNGSGMYPPLYSVYDKYFMGWMTPKFLAKDEVKNVTLTTTWNDNYQITGGASLVACTNTSTVYYLENRQKSGYDQYLPGHGMVVWKVTYNATRWNNNDLNNTAGTLRYTIVPADGKTKNYGATTDPFPGTGGKKIYTPATGCALSDITESSGNISFKYNGGVVKTTWDYVLSGENCTYPADGEITKDAALNLTITPNSGYSLADAACWEVTMGGTKLTYGTDFTYNAGTNKFTITSVTGDVEIIVSAGHPVNWYALGTKVAMNVAAEGKISLPAAPSDCSTSRQFVGWCTNSTYKSADTPPTYAKTGDVYSVANYYAVYADVSGGGSANATYTFSDKSWSASPSNWVSSKDGAGYINSGVQVTAKATGANATCPTSYSNISSVVVHYCTNASSGAGSIKMTVDGTDVSESVTSSGGTTPRDLEFDFSENTPTGTPKITVNCSTNSIYICGVTITYGSASYSGFSTDCTAPDPCTLTSISLNTSGVKTAFTTGEVFTSEGLVVTANYSNCSSKTVTPTGVSTPDMSSIGSKTVTVTYTENTVTKSTTYNITVSAPTTYAIRFFDGATQLKAESLIMGATATPPTVDDCDEYEFIGWYTSTLDTDNTTSHTWVTDFSVSGAQDYYAVFSHTEGSGGGGSSIVSDELTRATTGVTSGSTSYSSWSGKTAKSDAVYAGQSAGGNNAIQLRTTNSNSGIITTASGGKVKKVTVAWESNTANGRTINIYGKNSAYSAATELYNSSTSGTNLGSIVKGTSTELSITGDYEYIGIRSNSGALYLSSVTIDWSVSGGSSSTTYYTTTKDCTIPTEVTVKFDANGGEGIMTDQTIDYNTATALKANSFERTGYTFLGWATTADGAKVYDDEEEVTLTQKTTTLYAVWEKNSWNVYFTTPSGVTVVTANGATESPLTVEYGETVTIVISPDAEHTISTVTATGGAVLSGESNTRTFTMPDADVAISITMAEKPTYAVNFINMGETISSQSVIEGQTAVKPSDPSACEGYTFVGWWTAALATDNTTVETWVTDFTVTGAQDYYAVYSHTEGGGGGSEIPVTKTMNTFDAISGNVDDDANISYEAAKGGASTAPAVNSSQIRIYQNGGTLTIIAKNGKKITNVTIGSAMETSVTYSIDGGTTSSSQNISAGGNIALSDLNASTILFTCTGTDKNHRLYLNYLSVTYIGGGSGGGSTTYYTTSPSCTPCENKVTLTKGVESHGTFTLNKADGEYNNCDADFVVAVSNVEAAEGYRFVNVTATGGNNEVTGPDASGNYTITYTKGNSITSTITANFEEIPLHTVIWSANGDESNTASYQEGKAIVFPETASGCEGKVFVGWSATMVEETDVAPLFTTSALMGDHDVVYYAVFAKASGSGGGAWDGSTAGTYKIYAQVDGTKYYATGTGSKIDGSTDINDAADYTFEKVTDGWAIKTGDTYITYSSSTNLGTSGSAYTWSIETGTEGSWRINSETSGRAWIYRESTNVFGGYSTSNVNGTEYYDLEIGGGGGTSYSGYTTSCTPCENKVTLTKGTSLNGTFALDKADGEYENCAVGGLVVHVTDITPSEDYQFKEITQTGIATGVTIDQAGKTVTYAKDVAGTSTINVIFEPKPSYTIRFYNNESLIGSEQTVVSGKTPCVPSNPEACEGYAFVGWWTTALPASNTESHIWVTDFTATGNRDYYAIYRHNEGGSGSGTESVTFSDIYTSNTIVEDISIAIGTHTSVTFTKGGSDTQYYTNGDAIRWYGGGTCVVASDAGNITGITFTFGSGDGSNEIEAEGYVEPTWTGEASSVTFTQSGTSGNRRIAGISVTVDGGGTAHYTSVFSCSGHTITVAEVEHGSGVSDKSRCDEGGTVTITLTADEGYDCGGITTAPDVSVTEASECTYTFTMPDGDITVTPVFTPKTPRTFTFEKGTGICETATLTEAVWNGGVTLPVATANSGCDPEYVFAGWATSAVTIETEVRPTLYAAGTLYNGEETTLYAVYSQTTGGSASGFTLSYTIDDVTYYAVARTGTNKYMGATTDVADAARFTIVTSNDKQYLCWHGENDTYVSNNSNKTDLLFTTNIENAYSWDITETGNTIALVASSGRHFMFNTNTAQRDRFAAYSTDDVLVKGDAGTTVYNSIPSCVCNSVDITYNANGGTLAEGCENVTGGECERDWLLCDAPTREGYLFTNWKDQNGTLYDAGATVTDLKISLTLTAQWIPAPYTVLFDAGSGSCVESLTESSRGDGIILPKAEPSPACADDWTFIGWSATNLVGETNTSATIIGVAGVAYTPETNNVTLYAVYSTLDEGGATPDYTRVTDATPAEGDYAIVVAQGDESFGLLTYGTTAKGRLEYTKDYTSLPLTTISSPDATQIWHLTYDASSNAYLYNANAGAYLASSGTNITYDANAGSAFVFTKDPGTHGDYECLNSTASTSSNYYLGANKDADYIRYYGTTTLVATNSITLYKGSTGTRYYSTSPACTPCTDPEWSFEMGTSVTKTKGSEPFTNTVVKGHESSGTVTYSSTNEAVATVDATGLVTMRETGTTTITLRLTKAMPYCAAVLQYELEVKEPSIDIVGVTIDGEIILEHDLEGTITLDLSEGNAISTGTAANDLFFSKYFEAASNMKLFAIFNGTGHEMDLSNIRVRCNCTTSGTSVWPSKTGDLGYVELRTISKLREQYPKLKIPSGTELIFWSNNKGSTSGAIARNTELRECIEFEIGDMEYKYSDMEAMEIPNWFCLGDYTTYQVTDADGNNQFVFNGDDSMILERYNPATGQWEAIDLFGAGTSEAPADTEGLVENIDTEYEINGKMQELNDGNGFHSECEGNPIPLSTNRYMLVRKNTVLDGMTAVASNTTSFATLCDEWDGTPVGGTADAYCKSGNVFSEIAEYDYAENYIAWESITKDDYDVEEKEDGTTTVTFDAPLNLDARACSLLKIEVRDKTDATKILATTEYKIPIVVKEGDVMTTAELFHNQAEKCATCDVAILGSAILTKATDGATNDMPEVRDIYVYGGGKLVIPSGTHYRARDLIMRMQMADDKVNVEVPNVQVDGSLTNQYGGSIRQQVRVGTSRFYQFAVPYAVRLEDVTFSDGTPAVYGEDFMIRYYDGEQRAANQGTASNWRNFEGTQLMPGVGYTLAVAKKAGHEQRELVFPMSDASLNDGEPASKETTIHAWGDNSIRANHRGWNFLSNPYLTTYAENNLNEDAGGMLTTGQLVPDPDHPGWWISDEGTVPYVTLINSARTDYSQELVSLKELPPFTTFFIQAGDDDHSNGEEFSLTFDRAHRKASAPSYIRAAQKTPVARFGVLLSGNGAEDNCGVVVGEKYSAAYDMQADLSKEFGSAYSLKLYSLQEDKMQMAFLATHPDSLSKPIPLGVRLPANGEYTFSIDRRYNLGAFAHIYLTDNITGQHTDLLDDTYTFTGSRQQNDARFSLSVEMQKETPTDIQHLLNGVYAVGRDGSLLLTGMPETADIYIYDMGGRMVHSGHTQGATSITYPLPTGVYQIRVLSEGANALLRTIVY